MPEAKAWVVRGGKYGERDQYNLEKGKISIGFPEIPDLTAYSSREEIKNLVSSNIPSLQPGAVSNYAAQLYAFSKKISKDDFVILPIKNTAYLAVGKVTGDYKYDSTQEDPTKRHLREVHWEQTDLARSAILQDLLFSIGAFSTVFELKRHDAAWRVAQLAKGVADPGARVKGVPSSESSNSQDDEFEGDDLNVGINFEEHARNLISARIRERFSGHALQSLVAGILEAEGFSCEISAAGPDSGVDIIAGSGFLGMDSPRIVVQVKSSPSAVSDKEVSQLHGNIARHHADQGFLVAMGGVTKPAKEWLKGQSFKVTVWDEERLINEVIAHYEQLSDQIKSRLPLKQLWYFDELAE